jgi:hypothetical protein
MITRIPAAGGKEVAACDELFADISTYQSILKDGDTGRDVKKLASEYKHRVFEGLCKTGVDPKEMGNFFADIENANQRKNTKTYTAVLADEKQKRTSALINRAADMLKHQNTQIEDVRRVLGAAMEDDNGIEGL